ncbi:hypothetical protein Tco_1514504 [Tanacetum coccineum]
MSTPNQWERMGTPTQCDMFVWYILGKWIMKKKMRMISKDGTISEFPGYTSSKEKEEKEDEEEEEEEDEEEEEEKEEEELEKKR